MTLIYVQDLAAPPDAAVEDTRAMRLLSAAVEAWDGRGSRP
jgi:hypothetical protein